MHSASHAIQDHYGGGRDDSYSARTSSGKQAVICLKEENKSWQSWERSSLVERVH